MSLGARGGSSSRVALLFLLFTVLFAGCTFHERAGTGLFNEYSTASWYGPDFNGKPTSSGEIYDMYGKTAAHKYLPFGTILKVTNMENGKSTKVVVNDRGPFKSGRDIDLSYGAAKEIGLLNGGTGRVRLEVVGRDERYVKLARFDTKSITGPFTIQVGSFNEIGNAQRLRDALQLGYKGVYILPVEFRGKTLYRVRVGKFDSRDGAMATARKLANEGYGALVTGYVETI
jgi:rare lipoprotein A